MPSNTPLCMLRPSASVLLLQVTAAVTEPNSMLTISIGDDALKSAVGGRRTLRSNSINAVWDTVKPETRILSANKYGTTDNPHPLIFIDFRERVLASDPLKLFTASGFGRWGTSQTLHPRSTFGNGWWEGREGGGKAGIRLLIFIDFRERVLARSSSSLPKAVKWALHTSLQRWHLAD